MEGKYKIGRHEFETREEWESAVQDMNKIKSIVDQLDIDDPEQVLIIYKLIRDGRVTFTSQLGDAFFYDISDRVAQHSQMVIDGTSHGNKGKKSETKQSLLYKGIGITCIALALVGFAFFGISEYRERKSTKDLERVQEQKNISQAINWYIERLRAEDYEGVTQGALAEEAAEMPEEIVQPTPQVLGEYLTFYEKYPNFAGWLRIPDTQIDLPVMQSTDNAYYLNKNIEGKEDKNGTLFLDCRDDIQNPSTNMIIYGHNMKSGAMFGGLKQYLDAAYVEQHDTIQFDTIYEKHVYQIIAVCLSKVGYQGDDVTQYYDFIEAESAEDMQKFIKDIRECAVYDRTGELLESDRLLTLSTCNNYVEDGRLFVVARKIQ